MKFRLSRLSYFVITACTFCPVNAALAANLSWTGGNNLSTSGTGSLYSRGSHGSITFAGDDDYCGADKVVGRNGVGSATAGAISAFEQYQRFMNNTAFGSYHPYGTSNSQVVWTGDGLTNGNIGYQGALTGGSSSAMPTAYGVYSWASGCGSYATGNYSTAFGSNATATGAAAQAFGVSALASGTASVAVGVGAEAAGDSSVALGPMATAKGTNSLALGMGASAGNADDVALGSNSSTAAVTAVASGNINGNQYQFAGSAPASAVSIGSAGHERQLQNVAAGTLSQTSTDAINGSQLFATNSAVDKVGSNLILATKTLGGGAQLTSDGTFTGPAYQIQGSTRHSVGDALTTLDGAVTGNATTISTLQNNIASGTIGLLRQDPLSQAITLAATSGGTQVNFSGSAGARTLSGIKAGTLTADSTEAVTGRQLLTTNDNVAASAANIATNTADIATNTADIATNAASITAQGKTLTTHDGQLRGLTDSLGGGAQLAADGSFSGPAYQIQGGTEHSVGDALTALDGSVTRNSDSISSLQNNIASGTIGLLRQDPLSQAITLAATSGGTQVNFGGSAGARTLSGIKDGALTSDSTEAVTGSQLLTTNDNVAASAANIATNTADIAASKTDIATNTADIAASKTDIATNTADIATNTSSIAAQGKTLTTHDGQLRGLTDSLGGGAQLAADGTFTGPAYQIQGSTEHSVGDALTALDGSVTRNSDSISSLQNNIASGSVGLVQQVPGSQAITVAKASGGTQVDFSGSAGARTLSGIKAGALTADSTEAVTGSQLLTTNDNVAASAANIATNTADIAASKTDIATNTSSIAAQGKTLTTHDGQLRGLTDSLGGGAQLAADGSFTGPAYQIQGSTEHSVGDALTALDGSVTRNSDSISSLQNNIASGSVGLVQQDPGSQAITVAKASGGTQVDFSGSAGVRTLSGIKAGALTADSTEAVTGSQLLTTNDNVAASAANIATNTADIATNTSSIAAQGKTLTTHDGQLRGLTDSLGGGAQLAADGSFSGPAYQIQGGTEHSVGDALTALDGSVTRNSDSISSLQNNIASGSVGLVQQEPGSQAITVAKASGGTQVDFSGSAGARTLSGIKAGALTADSTEAVTGSQLFKTNSGLTAAVASLGGGASYDPALGYTAPAYTVQGQKKNSVGDALYALDDAVSVNSAAIGGLVNGTSGLIRQDSTTGTITIGSASGGKSLDVSGTQGDRVISGVANGSVSANSHDAVNGSQLYQTNQQVAKNTSDIGELSSHVQDVMDGKTGLVQQSSSNANVSVAANSGGSSVSVNGTDGDRRLTGVGNGVNDNDAATVGQLKDIQGNMGDSGMLAVNSDKTSKPTAAGKDAIALGAHAKAEKTGGVAIGSQAASQGERAIALGQNSQAQGEHSLALGGGSKVTGKNSVALGSDSTAAEDNVVSMGSSGHERRITNVARGVNTSDAATVGQMNDGFASLQNYTDRQVNHLNKRIGHLQDKLTAGVASAMALSGIPQAYQPDSSLFGAAGGSYGGASAIAVGMSHISENGHWITKLQASGNSQSDFGGTVGIGYQW